MNQFRLVLPDFEQVFIVLKLYRIETLCDIDGFQDVPRFLERRQHVAHSENRVQDEKETENLWVMVVDLVCNLQSLEKLLKFLLFEVIKH